MANVFGTNSNGDLESTNSSDLIQRHFNGGDPNADTGDDIVCGLRQRHVARRDGDEHGIYDSTTGALTFDFNGNLSGGTTQFAVLLAGPALTFADFEML